jgi:hypothetical protein
MYLGLCPKPHQTFLKESLDQRTFHKAPQILAGQGKVWGRLIYTIITRRASFCPAL